MEHYEGLSHWPGSHLRWRAAGGVPSRVLLSKGPGWCELTSACVSCSDGRRWNATNVVFAMPGNPFLPAALRGRGHGCRLTTRSPW